MKCSRYTLHLPRDVDMNSITWWESSGTDKRQISVSEHTNASGMLLAELHGNAPVTLEWNFLKHTGSFIASINHPGHYMLLRSSAGDASLQRVLQKPVMLVSDLDDTLIGHTSDMDVGSAEFDQFWTASRAAVVCQLVYNTGRTLPLYQQVWERKKHCLPRPDILVCGVGTRIYLPAADPGGWEEDKEWTARMGEGWDYQVVREVIDQIITDVGQDRVYYREEVELHEHKQTIMVHLDRLTEVSGLLQGCLSLRAVQAMLICGGVEPEWRFIDVVPLGAGKGTAMKYLAEKLGYGADVTVAAGDSANDRLMLESSQLAVVVHNCVPEISSWVQDNEPMCKVVYAASSDMTPGGAEVRMGGMDTGRVIVQASKEGALGVMQGLELLDFA